MSDAVNTNEIVVQAYKRCFRLLERLTPEERKRVLDSLLMIFGGAK